MKKIFIIMILVLFLTGCTQINQKNLNKSPDMFHIDKYFQKSELYCPDNNDEGGRLDKRKCYIEVPCYESGGRLKSIICDD